MNDAATPFYFDMILNMYDVLGSLHEEACQPGNQCPDGVCVNVPGVEWNEVCRGDSHKPYYLNIKVKYATFTREGSCQDSYWTNCGAYGIGDYGTNSDPYVEVRATATMWDGNNDDDHGNEEIQIYRKSQYYDQSLLTSQCKALTSECDVHKCKGRKTLADGTQIRCANCLHVDGTCWGYPVWDYTAQIGPITEANAKKVTFTLTVKDYDTISSDSLIGKVTDLSCPNVDSKGTTCTATSVLGETSFGTGGTLQGSGGEVTYEVALWTYSGVPT